MTRQQERVLLGGVIVAAALCSVVIAEALTAPASRRTASAPTGNAAPLVPGDASASPGPLRDPHADEDGLLDGLLCVPARTGPPVGFPPPAPICAPIRQFTAQLLRTARGR